MILCVAQRKKKLAQIFTGITLTPVIFMSVITKYINKGKRKLKRFLKSNKLENFVVAKNLI